MNFSLPEHLLDLLPTGVCVCDRQGAILRYNRQAAELWGQSPEAGTSRERFFASSRLFTPAGEALDPSDSPMARVLSTGVSERNRELLFERPDGSRVRLLANVDPVMADDGSLGGAVCSFHDITGRSLVRTHIPVQERRALELLEELPVAVYTTDADGRVTFCNPATIALWGSAPDPVEERWCMSWRLRWPDGRPMDYADSPMAHALEDGRAHKGVEILAERPDGSFTPLLAYPTPIRDDTGHLLGTVNTLVDVTERERGGDYSRRLAAIVEFSDDAIISKDLDGIITSWNGGAERLFGYKTDEVIGEPITVIIPPDRLDEEPQILERLRRGERVDHFETLRQRKDGSLVEISLTVSPVRDARGRIIGASKIARDITERRRMLEQQKLHIREMHHRVKNLFALASSVVSLSARSARTPEELAHAVRARLAALARALDLTLVPEDGQEGPDERRIQLDALIRTIVSPYEESAPGAASRITLEGPEMPVGGPAVTALALLLHEFATNAAKHGALSTPAGSLHVAWRLNRGELRLTWTESRGPTLAGEPRTQGFGSMLAAGIVDGQLGGSIGREWRPEGLEIRLSLPLRRLSA